MTNGTLYIVATPIGNREDITLRALRILSRVSYIACEDTRRTGMLLHYYREEIRLSRHSEEENNPRDVKTSVNDNHKPKLISFYDEVEENKIPEIISLLQSGNDVALVSDAGTPLISDPGFKLVRECHLLHIIVSPIPGPSSVTAALSVSGFPTDKFLFVGYLPKKKGKRDIQMDQIKKLKEGKVVNTIILLESPHRIATTLNELRVYFGDIDICICSELTKMFENVWKGKISLYPIEEHRKGEFVLVI